jgi:hypothetical protein
LTVTFERSVIRRNQKYMAYGMVFYLFFGVTTSCFIFGVNEILEVYIHTSYFWYLYSLEVKNEILHFVVETRKICNFYFGSILSKYACNNYKFCRYRKITIMKSTRRDSLKIANAWKVMGFDYVYLSKLLVGKSRNLSRHIF